MANSRSQKSPVGIRLPDELQNYLTQKAKASYRRLTSEIVMRLERTVEQDKAQAQEGAKQ
jgi:hypothetical protein